jgi:hypothetical protein
MTSPANILIFGKPDVLENESRRQIAHNVEFCNHVGECRAM